MVQLTGLQKSSDTARTEEKGSSDLVLKGIVCRSRSSRKNTLNLGRSSGKIDCLSSLDMYGQWIVKVVQSGFSHLLQWGLLVVSDGQGRKKGPLKDACVRNRV